MVKSTNIGLANWLKKIVFVCENLVVFLGATFYVWRRLSFGTLCAATFYASTLSNIQVKWRLRSVILRFVAVPLYCYKYFADSKPGRLLLNSLAFVQQELWYYYYRKPSVASSPDNHLLKKNWSLNLTWRDWTLSWPGSALSYFALASSTCYRVFKLVYFCFLNTEPCKKCWNDAAS